MIYWAYKVLRKRYNCLIDRFEGIIISVGVIILLVLLDKVPLYWEAVTTASVLVVLRTGLLNKPYLYSKGVGVILVNKKLFKKRRFVFVTKREVKFKKHKSNWLGETDVQGIIFNNILLLDEFLKDEYYLNGEALKLLYKFYEIEYTPNLKEFIEKDIKNIDTDVEIERKLVAYKLGL